ncbi:TPA: hypothetical protein IAA86_04170 [Candidatus Galligastranaerophilus intestinavium]|uniref:Uncharacterized protein n=1 Tax=Candidatus Galligastranaerophilus intestinavium TaxID=2840836 RepID=A0A9D1FI00_9BACT|nr:hypothetical protein [Candidatus Galligastranaerophilus intestinavium]
MKTQSIQIGSINSKYIKENNQNFKGSFLDAATKGLQMCDKYPMIGVALTDSVATDVPRTIFDLVKTGVPAAMETARREFSGLFVNCLMPSFIVLGAAKFLNKGTMGKEFSDINLSNSWANGESINKFVETFKNSMDVTSKTTTQSEIKTFFNNIFTGLNGRDGDKWVEFSSALGKDKLEEVSELLTKAVFDNSGDKKALKNTLAQVSSLITDTTHAGEILTYDINAKGFGSNLSELLRDSVDIAKKFTQESVRNNLDLFGKKATKLVNAKSILGLAIIVPIAMSVQSINRAITRHKYKQKGAPIYKDFEKGNTHKEMNAKEKANFFSQKIACAASMVSIALLSMMKKPSMQMFQFKGMFPTVDQCRWIATSTFVSRMFASEDPNELRESTVRDIASFSGLYFLGDYAAKAAASIIEKIKPDVKLLNRTGKSNAQSPILNRIGDWIKNTYVKSFDEVLPKDKNMRSICELASLGFSIISLGILLPAYNRQVTEKKVAQAKQKELQQTKNATKSDPDLIIELRTNKALAQDGIYNTVAQGCFE